MKLALVFLVCFAALACAQFVLPQYQRAPFYYYPAHPEKYVFVPYKQKPGFVQARTPNEEEFTDPDGRFFNFLTSITSNVFQRPSSPPVAQPLPADVNVTSSMPLKRTSP